MLAVDRPVDPLQEGVDLAIRVRTKLDSSALKMRSLGISRKILVTDPRTARTVGNEVQQLAMLPTLNTSEESGETEWTLVGPGGLAKRIRHEPRMRCADFSAIRKAAADGIGIAFLPDHVCHDDLAEGRLVQVFPAWHSPDGFVHVVFTARRGLAVAVRAFLDHLVKAFPPSVLSSRDVDMHPILSDGAKRNARTLVDAP
jgi:DNA-binding transcriptional LysR family regulator